MATPGASRALPALNAVTGLFRGTLQKFEVGGSVAVAGLPFLILLITKFEGGDAEGAVNALVLPDADMYRAFPKLVRGLIAWSGSVIGRFLEGRNRLCHGDSLLLEKIDLGRV